MFKTLACGLAGDHCYFDVAALAWSLGVHCGWEEEQREDLIDALAPTKNLYIARFDLTSRSGERQNYQFVRSDGLISRVGMTEAIALQRRKQSDEKL